MEKWKRPMVERLPEISQRVLDEIMSVADNQPEPEILYQTDDPSYKDRLAESFDDAKFWMAETDLNDEWTSVIWPWEDPLPTKIC